MTSAPWNALDLALDLEAKAIDEAVRQWAKQSGTTPEQWVKRFGVKVKRNFGLTLTISVSATGSPGQLLIEELPLI